MKMITPILINDAAMAASTLEENDADGVVWAAGTHAINKRVRRPNHRIYQCAVAHTATNIVADYPENNLTGTAPRWVLVGATNKWAAFDGVVNTKSLANAADNVLSWTLTPESRFSDVALYGVEAAQVRVRVTVDGVIKYDQSTNMRMRNTRSWSEWFNKPIAFRRAVAFGDIPVYRGAVLEIIATWEGNRPSVGDIQIGRADLVGEVQDEPGVSFEDYSVVTKNRWGDTTFTPGKTVRIIDIDVFVDNENASEVDRILRSAASAGRGFIIDDRFDHLNCFGYVVDSDSILRINDGSMFNIKIQELT